MKILLGSLMHESNTFSPVYTDSDAFERTQHLQGDRVLAHHRGGLGEVAGMLGVLDERGVEILPTLSAVAMCSGMVRRETYDALKQEMLDGVRRRAADADGILLALHGSMTVEGIEDPEGDLLRSVRALLPRSVPIGVSLDHHANVTPEMIDNCDFAIGYRTHPHTDQYAVGRAVAEKLLDLLGQRHTLRRHFIKLPLLTPAENRPEAIALLAAAVERIERDPHVFTASFFVAYPWADLSIVGASTLCITVDDAGAAQRYARQLADIMWAIRREFQFPIHSIEEAVQKGAQMAEAPILLDELPDCTLGGAAGDVVTSTRYLVEKGVPDAAVAGIVDPRAVEAAGRAGVGARVHLRIGGLFTREDNEPLAIDAVVKNLQANIVGDPGAHPGFEAAVGRIAVVEANGVQIVLIEFPGKIDGPGFLEKLGIDPRRRKFIVSKEGLNPFVTYRPLGARVLMVESAGLNRQRLRPSDYRRVPRPLWPLDPEMAWPLPDRRTPVL
jgi:microcystin degradation protein MlrC